MLGPRKQLGILKVQEKKFKVGLGFAKAPRKGA